MVKFKRLVPVAALIVAGPFSAGAECARAGTTGCPTGTYYTTSGRVAGWNGTASTSKQLAGPVDTTFTEGETTTQAFGASAALKVGANAIIASAKTTFGVNYTYTSGSSSSYSYHLVVPAGKTGVLAVLHRQDRVTAYQHTERADCTEAVTASGDTYIPIQSEANIDYCVRRDFTPYDYMIWKTGCTGE